MVYPVLKRLSEISGVQQAGDGQLRKCIGKKDLLFKFKNLPTICQWFVAQALSPAWQKYPQAIIIHYMAGLLIAVPTYKEMEEARASVVTEVWLFLWTLWNAEWHRSSSKLSFPTESQGAAEPFISCFKTGSRVVKHFNTPVQWKLQRCQSKPGNVKCFNDFWYITPLRPLQILE